MKTLLWLMLVMCCFEHFEATAGPLAVGVKNFCLLAERSTGKDKDGAPVTGKTVFCWDNKGQPQNIPVTLDNPTAVVVGARLGLNDKNRVGYGCAINSGKIVCWGQKSGNTKSTSEMAAERLNKEFKDFHHTSLIAAGATDFCAYDDELGLKCDGHISLIRATTIAEEYKAKKYDKESFIALDVGTFSACGVTRNRTTLCWGTVREEYKKDLDESVKDMLSRTPPFAEIKASALPELLGGEAEKVDITVGAFHACHSSQVGPVTKVNCWGNEKNGEVQYTDFDADFVNASTMKTCTTKTAMFQCKGVVDADLKEMVANGDNFAISVVSNKEDYSRTRATCRTTEQEVICSGSINARVKATTIGLNLAELEKQLEIYAYHAYPEKAAIMDRAAELVKTVIPTDGDLDKQEARLFVLGALKPMVERIDSPYFVKNVLPQYAQMYEIYTNKFRAKELGKLKNERVGAIAVGLLEISLRAVKEYLMLESERKALEDFLDIVTRANATAKAGEAQKVAILQAHDYRRLGDTGEKALKEIVSRLNHQTRYKGISTLLSVLTVWLATY